MRRRALFVLVFGLLASCGGGGDDSGVFRTVREGSLTVGSDIAYAPFESVDPQTSKPVGFDVDLMTEIGKRNNLETRFVNQTFSGIIAGLIARKYDAIASAMTITEERRKQVAFSDPYFDADQSLVVNVKRTPEIDGTEALAGKVVGVQAETTGESWAQENLEGKVKEIKSYETADDAFLDLKAGKIDGIVNDIPVNLYRQKLDADFKVVEEIKTDEHYGIAIRKDNEALLERVNAALAAMRSDGSYDTIYERWFGRKPGAPL